MTRKRRFAKTRPHGIEEAAARVKLDERVARPPRPRPFRAPQAEPVETVWLLAGNGVIYHVPAGGAEHEQLVQAHAAVEIAEPQDAA